MPSDVKAVLLAENDAFQRILPVILDPQAPEERRAAYAHLVAHELRDFDGWCERIRREAPALYPADVRLIATQDELRANLPDATAAIVDALRIGPEELRLAPKLKAVQKYGTVTSNIDLAACAARNLPVLTLRRCANSAVAEHALALMLAFARQLHRCAGLISFEQLSAAGYAPERFDGRHVPTSGWARITGLKILRDSTLGILGMGEIGRELAPVAAALGMRVVYYQRNRLAAEDEQRFRATWQPLDILLGQSDWVSVHLPLTPQTRGLVGRAQIAAMKRGAVLINASRAEIVDRDAAIEALRSGRLGGLAIDAQYEEPGRADDALLQFDNVILTPHIAGQPRINGLVDFEALLVGLSRTLSGAAPR